MWIQIQLPCTKGSWYAMHVQHNPIWMPHRCQLDVHHILSWQCCTNSTLTSVQWEKCQVCPGKATPSSMETPTQPVIHGAASWRQHITVMTPAGHDHGIHWHVICASLLWSRHLIHISWMIQSAPTLAAREARKEWSEQWAGPSQLTTLQGQCRVSGMPLPATRNEWHSDRHHFSSGEMPPRNPHPTQHMETTAHPPPAGVTRASAAKGAKALLGTGVSKYQLPSTYPYKYIHRRNIFWTEVER